MITDAHPDMIATLASRIDDMIDALSVRDGGFSINPMTGTNVTGGYAVAIHPECCAVLAEITGGDLLEFMIRNAATLALPGRVMGGWCDPSDGRIYLDVSIMTADRDEAMALAIDHDQLAIFDFANGESITTY